MSLVMNGINPDAKRHPDDFYVTEPRAVIELMEALESLKIGLPPIVVDSSVGSGIIADAVQLYGHDVIGYDVEDRGWAGTRLQDFLTVKAADLPDGFAIIQNPPFRLALDFIRHGLDLLPDSGVLCSFERISFLEGACRREFFDRTPPAYVMPFTRRVKCCGLRAAWTALKLCGLTKRKNPLIQRVYFCFVKGVNMPSYCN